MPPDLPVPIRGGVTQGGGPDPFTLLHPRVHEAEGRGRRAFALFQAARHEGPVMWILPAHAPELPMLRGLPQGVGERLHLIRPTGETDLLWCIEETLRASPVGLVIAEPQKPLSLTAGRRFQLAAEAGRTTKCTGLPLCKPVPLKVTADLTVFCTKTSDCSLAAFRPAAFC